MKFYSDTLTADDIRDACRTVGVQVEIATMKRPRTRSRGWEVQLTNWRSNRHRNSGKYGADTTSSPPATYDQHGEVMAILFHKDEDAKLSWWDTDMEFRAATYKEGPHAGELFTYHMKTPEAVAA